MGGLIVLVSLLTWIAVCVALAAWLVRRLRPKRYEGAVASLLFLVILILPVADELAARPKFEALCREGAVLKIDAERIKGKTVRVDISPVNSLVEGMPIPVLYSHFRFRDVRTGEVLAEYETYQARGGFMARATGFPGGPWAGNYSCVSDDEGTIPRRYGFTLINQLG
jgi:hypothetical protein